MTDLDLRAGQIHRGLGVVARWPDIALVIPSDAAHDAIVDEMFHGLGPAPTSTELVTAVNNLLAEDKLQSVGMLVEATGGPLAMAYGPVEVLVDGERLLEGTAGGVRKQLPTTATRLTVRASNLSKAAEPVAPYDLRRGIAPGAGLTLVAIAGSQPPAPASLGAPAPVPPPARPAVPEPPASEPDAGADLETLPPDDVVSPDDPTLLPEPEHAAADHAGLRSGAYDEPSQADAVAPQIERAAPAIDPNPLTVPFRSVVLLDAPPPDDATPLPIADVPKTGELSRAELDAGRVEVQGILCPRQHFNNPDAANCMVCGLSMLHLTRNLVRGPRPTLGFIVFDDGSTFGLDRSYVIGREPTPASDAPTELLILHDNNETLSRTHAELRLEDWTVQLVDLASTNGTYIWDQEFERWNQLTPGHPVQLNSGDTVALGRRTFVFESVSRG